MLRKKLQKIIWKLNRVNEVKELSIDDLELLRDMLDKNLEHLLGFYPHQVIEMINIVLEVKSDASLKNIYNVGKALHKIKYV